MLREYLELVRRSPYFDEQWYLAHYPDVGPEQDALKHYLQYGVHWGRDPGPGFSAAWYCQTYPDVAKSGMHPFLHFLLHGQHEGRLPQENRAMLLDDQLWAGLEERVIPQLECYLSSEREQEQAFACWSLGRWFAFQNDWQRVADLMLQFNQLKLRLPLHLGPCLLGIDALIRLGALTEAQQWLENLIKEYPDSFDLALLAANLVLLRHKENVACARLERINILNQHFKANGFAPLTLKESSQDLSLDNLAAPVKPFSCLQDLPLVSVIMPVFNAETTLVTALEGLLSQSYQNLEIIVIDDCSKDKSYTVAKELALKDQRLRVFRQAYNGGAYVARNTGLALARGEFLTTHDADDWSHPQKIERQALHLLDNKACMATTSHWVRCTQELVFGRWRVEEGWIYRNVSSLMFRRRVFETLGFWDRVSVNADTEYYYRIARAFGQSALAEVSSGVPLSLGRFDAGSLSQTSLTHLRTQFFGVRKDYHDSALKWHESITDIKELHLSDEPEKRPFSAPEAIDRPVTYRLMDMAKDIELLHKSGLFDEAWYRRRYPNLDFSQLEPIEHFLLEGGFQDLDPSARFSSSGYSYAYRDIRDTKINPALHYLKWGQDLGRVDQPKLRGCQAFLPEAKRIVFVAHSVGEQIFGSERSLIDLVKAASELGYQVYVIFPNASNPDYLDEVMFHCYEASVIPYAWWRLGREAEPEVTAQIVALLSSWHIDWMHVNTSVLLEPHLAAREANIPVVVHIRELPEHDKELCDTLEAEPEDIRKKILSDSDKLIANSQLVAKFFAVSEKTQVLANTVDLSSLNLPNRVNPKYIKVALISSNLPKKGLEDFVDLAQLLEKSHPTLRFILIGPNTPYRQALVRQQENAELSQNIILTDYVLSTQEAIGQANIVLNLSHFQESFGRTVLEAMAARRPVICYAWGALPELVIHGETGFLAPFRDLEACSGYLQQFAERPELINIMGEKARQRVAGHFSFSHFKQGLAECYQHFFSPYSSSNKKEIVS